MSKLYSTLIIAIMALFVANVASFAGDKLHRVAFHVDQNDPQLMNMTLKNVRKYYDSKGEKVVIEVVAYGPGLMMLREDKSPVKDRIAALSLEISDLKFSACGNTQRKMSKKSGKEIVLVSEASMVTSGVVRLIELQKDGYSYVRP